MIPDHAPVYMRDDLTYCSSMCRDRGLSRLVLNLKEARLARVPSGGSDLCTASVYKSDASPTAKTEVTDLSVTDDVDCQGPQRSATEIRLVLRTYSTSVLWGRGVAENSAVAPLFNYLPQVDHYMAKDVSYADMSPRSDRFSSSQMLGPAPTVAGVCQLFRKSTVVSHFTGVSILIFFRVYCILKFPEKSSNQIISA
ncbi:unnamed protein product [Durusdinium trenchii]|uniref:Uncharacterized protein n=1 Tax=Durusdinium trenchii TaxID=1381693 RepID=A0ABP0J854_9DINO